MINRAILQHLATMLRSLLACVDFMEKGVKQTEVRIHLEDARKALNGAALHLAKAVDAWRVDGQ